MSPDNTYPNQPPQFSNQPPQWTPPGTAPEDAPKAPQRHNRLRLVIALAVVLLLVGIGADAWYFLSHAGDKHADQTNLDNAVDFDNSGYTNETTVQISSGVFTSTNVLIAPHTRLNVINEDSFSHYITTTDPNQSDGPATDEENDPRLPLGNEIFANGGYSHVFEKPGTYAFHLTDEPTNLTVVVK